MCIKVLTINLITTNSLICKPSTESTNSGEGSSLSFVSVHMYISFVQL